MAASSMPSVLEMGAGKHPSHRLSITGAVKSGSVRPVSKRLIFFTIVVAEAGEEQECLAKFRDGCVNEEEIQTLSELLAERATSGEAVRVAGFPEVDDECSSYSIHVIQATFEPVADGNSQRCSVPETPREPTLEEEKVQTTAKRKQSGSHSRPNTANRHQQFVSWLIEHFGRDLLQSGAGVLDVAGGAGGIAFELAFRRGIPCVVIDPRPMKLNSRQRRALKNRANSQAVLSTAPPPCSSWWLEQQQKQQQQQQQQHAAQEETSHQTPAGAAGSMQTSTEMAPPQQLDDNVQAQECGECTDEVANNGSVHVPPSYAQAWAEEGIGEASLPRQICGYLDEGFADGAHAELWRNISMVVGMHPDQATEPAVRLALAHGKPFAVVPCCVFAKSHPGRRLPSGKAVETHEEFCSYLAHLGAGQAAQPEVTTLSSLPFEGRNVVVHSPLPTLADGRGQKRPAAVD